ncbi:hypothetical protein CSA56_11205 [candidate division KSB3 bacterium]|uniref:Uncharacterized protein n=1 Tax=candidate division KSB3 bacterium TaxID=2044937 RepID=A0A2G6KFE5_9BACT|nr:MAG: hypothetical protein CSA56_11205 [candidate division KSB3 bacterium]
MVLQNFCHNKTKDIGYNISEQVNAIRIEHAECPQLGKSGVNGMFRECPHQDVKRRPLFNLSHFFAALRLRGKSSEYNDHQKS